MLTEYGNYRIVTFLSNTPHLKTITPATKYFFLIPTLLFHKSIQLRYYYVMKIRPLTFLFALTFLFLFSGSSVVFGNDLQDGLGAYDRGDYKEAVKWYRLAAEQGDAKAQYYLGMMYGGGRGVPRDEKKAIKWLLKAAEQRSVGAQRLLGAIFYYGWGVQDYTEAAKWYKKAAEQGDRDAQNILGAMYERGKGIPKDFVEAYKWFSISGESGNEHGRMYREKIGKRKMTPDQITEAQRLAKEWVEKNK
jgi:TPR repeat protein